jgi:hypothetical protein
VLKSHIGSQCDAYHVCHSCDTHHMCHPCNRYHCHLSLFVKCVIEGLVVTNFNKVRGGEGQKVLSRPSADSLAVGQKQKGGGGGDTL